MLTILVLVCVVALIVSIGLLYWAMRWPDCTYHDRYWPRVRASIVLQIVSIVLIIVAWLIR